MDKKTSNTWKAVKLGRANSSETLRTENELKIRLQSICRTRKNCNKVKYVSAIFKQMIKYSHNRELFMKPQ